MSAPDFSDVSKPSDTKVIPPLAMEKPQLPPPAFSDIAKSSNDLINKDFYHNAKSALEVKLRAPNGVSFNTKGTMSHDQSISGVVEAKKVLSKGVTLTQGWATSNALSTKFELDNNITDGLKVEVANNFSPSAGNKGQKVAFFFKQPMFHTRVFADVNASQNVSAIVDATIGYQGFLAGGEVGYDVQKAAVTRYSAAVGYAAPNFTAAVASSQNFNLFTATYYQKVNREVEAGVKATYDASSNSNVGLELASKYKLDALSFAKAKVNDSGILSLAYNTKINSGFTFGSGISLDTKKLNESGHKIGANFVFEG